MEEDGFIVEPMYSDRKFWRLAYVEPPPIDITPPGNINNSNMSYTFDTELLSAAALNQNPTNLQAILSSPQVSDPTAYDVVLDQIGPCVYGIAFNKLTVTSANSSLVVGNLGDGSDAGDTFASGVLVFTGNALVPQPAQAQLSGCGVPTEGQIVNLNTTEFTFSSATDIDAREIKIEGVLQTLTAATAVFNAYSATHGIVSTYSGATSAITMKSTLSSYVPNTYPLSPLYSPTLVFRDINNTVYADFLSGGSIDTVTIGGTTYTFQPSAVEVGANTEASILNLISAINGNGNYTADTNVTAASSTAVTGLSVVAITSGTIANGISTIETVVSASWEAPALSGGAENFVGGTEFRAAQAYHGATFAVLSCNAINSIFTFNSAGSAQSVTTTTEDITTPEDRRKWILGYW